MNKKEQKITNDSKVTYFNAKITCITCSAIFNVGSTKAAEIRVDTCSNCHPFYTGEQQSMRETGQVEKFTRKQMKQQEFLKDKQPVAKTTKAKVNKKEVSLEDLKQSLVK